ncbi:acyl-CoA dehydrogenase [Pseudoclavibacter endophyticus]|uniref:Acyl-CoA dehydrogenase n=1 Tax=Pseudoclavibacter endophyticus TaxID=1778590 RepID=A0A6H9WJR3_9MICO|nr:acyl-CoA dehydrogenase family protein [Pseudoclavibacter endophyticus]KAB1646896.1 acyl-CoA dehydrogenase [Pseudoclavibacter endophyticus]GGA74625.1 acyl-CoA dehydrogenase [Pseudoclavibacter endophyticus]
MHHDSITASDLLGIDLDLSDAERELRDRVSDFVNRRIRPGIADWFDRAVFPLELVPELGELGLLGMHLHGYGCAGRSAVEYGIAMRELEAGDSGIRTFVSVQGSLAMSAISKFGSEQQKEAWLPRMARGEVIGCFGLTEPAAGSDPSDMRTTARRDGDEWVIDGEKRWIGLASVAGVAVIWANTEEGVRGFVVPTDTPGFSATPITQKLSMRASIQCDVALKGVRLPADALLPGASGLRGPFSCLNEARYGIAWGAVGAARDSFDAALAYARGRTQFGRPIAGHQLTQQKLVNMALEIQKAQLIALRLGRLKDEGRLEHTMISVGKLNNTRIAIETAREARTIFGGNGITLDYSPMRHAANLESVRTYEGTDEVHTLILGQKLTGLSAFH